MRRRSDNLQLLTPDTPLPAVDPALAEAVRRFRRAKAELALARVATSGSLTARKPVGGQAGLVSSAQRSARAQPDDRYRGWGDLYAADVRRRPSR